MYLFKESVKNFNWCINIKQIAIILVLFIIVKITPKIVLYNGNNITLLLEEIKFLFSLKRFISCTFLLIYPAFYEEIIYRGLLISMLKGYDLEDWKINCIQSLVFGLPHAFLYFYK